MRNSAKGELEPLRLARRRRRLWPVRAQQHRLSRASEAARTLHIFAAEAARALHVVHLALGRHCPGPAKRLEEVTCCSHRRYWLLFIIMSEERSSILLLPIHAPCYPARNSPIICKAVGVDVTSKLIMVRKRTSKISSRPSARIGIAAVRGVQLRE